MPSGRAKNMMIVHQNMIDEAITGMTSPTIFAAGMPLSNLRNDRLTKVARSTGDSMIIDLDFGRQVPITVVAALAHNLTENARWRIRGAMERNGSSSDSGGFSFPEQSTVYDSRPQLRTGTARGAYVWGAALLDHDFSRNIIPSGANFSRAGSAVYRSGSGLLLTAVADQGRFESGRLLIEESATNLYLRSSEFGTGWTLSNVTISSNSATAPDDSSTADKMVPSTSNATHLAQQSVTLPAAAVTMSCYAKAAGYSWIAFQMGASGVAYYNISLGTIGVTTGGGSTSIEAIGNGWYRCVMTRTPPSGASLCSIYVANGNNIPTFSGDGVSGVYFWEANIVSSPYVSSPVTSAGTTSTRAADVATMPVSALPFSATEGTILATFKVPYTAGTSPVITLDDSTANERIRFVVDAGNLRAQIVDGGVTQADLNLGAVSAGVEYRAAIAWSANDIAGCVDGGSVATDASASIPTVTTLTWGVGSHARTTYIADRISNAELQTLTSPSLTETQRQIALAPHAGQQTIYPIVIGAGSKIVYVDDPDMRFYVGSLVRLAIDEANYMEGTVVEHDVSLRRLTVFITVVAGSGSATTMTVTRYAEDITVWPDVTPFADGGYWGRFTWGGLLPLLGKDYLPPGLHLPMLYTGNDEPVYVRYMKIEISDISLDYIDIGRLLVGPGYQPTINISFGWQIEFVDPSLTVRSRGGQFYSDVRPKYRVLNCNLDWQERNEIFSNLYEIDRDKGVSKPIMVIIDPTDVINIHRLTVYGVLVRTSPISNPSVNNLHSKQLELQECL